MSNSTSGNDYGEHEEDRHVLRAKKVLAPWPVGARTNPPRGSNANASGGSKKGKASAKKQKGAASSRGPPLIKKSFGAESTKKSEWL